MKPPIEPLRAPSPVAARASATTARPARAPAPSPARVTAPESLRTARRSRDAEAVHPVQPRGGSTASRQDGLEARARELIARELSAGELREVPAKEPSLREDPSAPGRAEVKPATVAVDVPRDAPPPVETSAGPSTAAVLALVEKVEVFLRSGRPGLSLTLSGAFAAEVTVERTGPGRIAVRLKGRNGPLRPEAIALLRGQLAARGLRVSGWTLG